MKQKQKEFVNLSNIPDYAIERIARCVLDDIRADFAKEEVQRDFAIWQAERAKKADARNTKRKIVIS